MGKIFANDMPSKELISEIYKQLIQLNIKKLTQFKKDRRTEQTIFQRRHTDNQQANHKVLKTVNRERNTKQNHNEIPLHTYYNSHHQNDNK